VATESVTEEETIRLHRIRGQQETADRSEKEEVRTFEEGRSGQAAFGRTISDKETGDIALYKALIEIGEQMGEA